MTDPSEGEITDDAILGGRLQLLQPAAGHRAGIDAVLLAAAVAARSGELTLEGGAGVGTAGLCLARRTPGVSVDMLEIDPVLADLARQNAQRNSLADAVEVYCGSIAAPPYRITANSYHHVFMNPPFQEVGAGSPSPHPGKASAYQESALGLRDWIRFATAMARPGGCITLIHRADRLDDVLAALKGRAGGCELFSLWPGNGKPTKRVIVRAYKGNDGPLVLLPGLVLHESGAKYTQAAEQVLRHAGALDFTGNQK
ncbi:MAG: methyltransferase [Alphaproteobacteria bacterium]|nr:methyltransferase [Alphaproteobacteria bacterium]